MASALVKVCGTVDDFKRKYDLTDSCLLGSGASGKVCTVQRRGTDDEYAMKVVEVGDSDRAHLRKEIDVHKKLDHPNICRIIESFEDEFRIYIIMELCTGGALVERMSTAKYKDGMGEAAAATIMEKILSAILYCHQHGIVHRDVKMDNIIFQDECEDAEPKLIDFGFAKAVKPGREEAMYDLLGTPSYMAPELWVNRPSANGYDSSVDMWALGVTAYMLLCGERPFHHHVRAEKGRMIREDPLHFVPHRWAHVSQAAQDFCRALLQKQPKDRMCASQAIQHRWITQRSRRHSDSKHATAALRSNASIVYSLEDYAESEPLRQLALEIMAFSTPPQRLQDLRKVFQAVDTDDSGTLSIKEFKEAMKPILIERMSAASTIPSHHPEASCSSSGQVFSSFEATGDHDSGTRAGGLSPTPLWVERHSRHASEEIERIFERVDASKSGEIDYTEFLAATLSSHGPGELRKSVGAAFSMLDTSADGFITRADLETAFTGALSETELDSMMQCANVEGRVSPSTFEGAVLGAGVV